METIFRNHFWWIKLVVETIIIISSISYLIVDEFAVLVGWELLAAVYVVLVFVAAWGGIEAPDVLPVDRKRILRMSSWFTQLASLTGINSAVIALIAKQEVHADSSVDAMVAAIGVVLSWMLMQIGFAQIYEMIDASEKRGVFQFPGDDDVRRAELMDYLYFAFTIGSSFATSDPTVVRPSGRPVVLLHSIVAFFYNAIVVAVAIQVLQGLIK